MHRWGLVGIRNDYCVKPRTYVLDWTLDWFGCRDLGLGIGLDNKVFTKDFGSELDNLCPALTFRSSRATLNECESLSHCTVMHFHLLSSYFYSKPPTWNEMLTICICHFH